MAARREVSVHWSVAAGAAVVVVILALGAGLWMAGGRHDCNLMLPAPSNVRAEVESAGWRVAELCVAGECEEGDTVEVSDDAGVHRFRATVVGPEGRSVEHSGEVTTVEVWPNGEGCGTRTYGAISISAAGTVSTFDPWAAASAPSSEPGPAGLPTGP